MAPSAREPEPPQHSIRQVLALSAPIGLAFIPLGMALGFLVGTAAYVTLMPVW